MIFLHRFNKNEKPKNGFGIEIDVRLYQNNIVLSHNYASDKIIYLEDCLNNFKNTKMIIDCKESGIEQYVIKLLKQDFDYYFLDSQIPDIIKLLKDNKKNIIIRKSQYESDSLFYKFDLCYKWIDWFQFEPFILEHYLDYINEVSKDKKANNILVSPELYSKNYLPITKTINKLIPKNFSVCTDNPELWEHLK